MLGFSWHHLLVIVLMLAFGFWLGKTYPGALAGVPVVGSL